MNSDSCVTTKSCSNSPHNRDTHHHPDYRQQVSIDLAIRLLASGTLTRPQARAALMQHTTQAIPLVRALLNSGVPTEAIEHETRCADVPHLHHVTPLLDAVERLPKRICRQLLTVPVRIDPITHTVDVAVADPFDVHAHQEIAYHLDAPIRIVRASLHAIDLALDEIGTAMSCQVPLSRTLAFGALEDKQDRRPIRTCSDMPIPLVRKS